MKTVLILFMAACISWVVYAQEADLDSSATNVPASFSESIVNAASAPEEDMPDFEALNNPFESKMPNLEIIETPIAMPEPVVDNKPEDVSKVNGKDVEEPKIIEIKLPSFEVQGIVWDSDHPQVIINDQIYSLGDQFDNILIKKIYKRGLMVVFMGRKFHVSMD